MRKPQRLPLRAKSNEKVLEDIRPAVMAGRGMSGIALESPGFGGEILRSAQPNAVQY
jgi:hypothetical protein